MPTYTKDAMFAELRALISSWRTRGIDDETILCRMFCIAVSAMRGAGVELVDMQDLIKLHYSMRKARIIPAF